MKSLLKTLGVTAGFILVAIGVFQLYSSESGRLTVTAQFDDVADLAINAPVQLSDVRVGRISDIELVMDGAVTQAHITMKVDESASVPANSVPMLRRTSVLGEKFIELLPVDGRVDGPPLVEGTDLGTGVIVSDLEQLVSTGEELFAVIAEDQLAVILDEGARAFDGQGATVRKTLDNFALILDGYGDRTDDISRLITNLETFSSTTGPQASSHADALTNLAETIDNLESQRVELIDLLVALDELALEGKAVLDDHLDEIARAFDALAATTDTIVRNQDDLAAILQNLPGHNLNLPLGVQDNFVQVLNDVVVCGFPGGGEQDTPVHTCTNKFADDIPRQSEEPDAKP